MIKHYTLTDKPSFKMNQRVSVDMAVMGMPDYGILPGRIVGKSVEHVLDNWLVEFNRDFGPTYPYTVIAILHTAFMK
jgi:hypothetical protein